MTALTLRLRSGRDVTFDVALDGDGPAHFALGVRRSGSSLFTTLVQALAAANRRHCVNFDTFFENDIAAPEWQNDPAVHDLIHPGNVYVGCREMPISLFDNELFLAGRRLLLVRDPRDALVSLYFAVAYSHPLPQPMAEAGSASQSLRRRRQRAQQSSIDDYVLFAADAMVRTLIPYQELMSIPGTILFRYEDVIFHKREWLEDIAAGFGWTVSEDELRAILSWADVAPPAEDPHAFIRQITPGDHREKLRPETIARLNERLAPVMAAFGYAP